MLKTLYYLDRNNDYAKRLSKRLLQDPSFPYEVVFLSAETSSPAALDGKTEAVLLFAEGERSFSDKVSLPKIMLTEAPSRENDRSLCKYQPYPTLVAELLKKMEKAEKSGENDTFSDLHNRLLSELQKTIPLDEDLSDEELHRKIEVLLSEDPGLLLTDEEKKAHEALLFAALRRFDLLSILMDDPSVTEVMINGASKIFLEKGGKVEQSDRKFTSEERLIGMIQRISAFSDRRINASVPMADAGLPDGSRVNMVLPPVSLSGPVVTVRRFPEQPVTMEDLIEWGSISRAAAEYLQVLVRCRYTLFISGGTGAGKTTFLQALAGMIPQNERVITIEDSPELQIRNLPNLVRLATRPANLEGLREITVRQLLRNALRMRPDRIIVGEIRGAEALDMLQAMNTGHDGSISTGHGNSAKDMLFRIETMCMMADHLLPLQAIRQQISSALDLLVHLSRFRDGSRRVTGIYELRGMQEGEIVAAPLFIFREEGEEDGKIKGRLYRTKERLQNREKLQIYGGRLPKAEDPAGGTAEGGGHPAAAPGTEPDFL